MRCPQGWLVFGFRPLSGNQKKEMKPLRPLRLERSGCEIVKIASIYVSSLAKLLQ